VRLNRIILCVAALLIPASTHAQKRDTIVKTVSVPKHRGIATLVPELKIGKDDGPEEYLFGGPSEVLMLRDGSVVILDWAGDRGNPIARRYDRSGKFLNQVGRPGKGPGEYSAPTGMSALPDGRFIIGDSQNGRLDVYSSTGKPVADWTIAGYRTLIRGMDWLRTDPRGTTYMRMMLPTKMRDPEQWAVLRIDANGHVRDTLQIPFAKKLEMKQVYATRPDGRGSYGQMVPYYPMSWWTVSSAGFIVTGTSDEYAIDFNQGNRVVRVRRNVAPVKVSAAERKDQHDYIVDYLRFYVPSFDGSVPDVPQTKPFFRGLRSFQDGRVWVTLSTPSVRCEPREIEVSGRKLPGNHWCESDLYDVFDPDGTYVGMVSPPKDVYLLYASGDVAWGVTRDADDIPSVVRYRITWPKRPDSR
jgi:hypothetical protein